MTTRRADDCNHDRPCVILGARPVTAGMLCYVREDAFVITADAGWRTARRLGLPVHLAVGDFDSAPPPDDLPGERLVYLPAEKDDTDTYFAAREALRRGFRDITLLGVLGGRLDHSLGSLATLLHLTRAGALALLADENTEVRCAAPGATLFVPQVPGAYLSVFPAGGEAGGVCLRGVKYPLEDARLCADSALGVSNEFASATARVSCAEGGLFVLTVREGAAPETGADG